MSDEEDCPKVLFNRVNVGPLYRILEFHLGKLYVCMDLSWYTEALLFRSMLKVLRRKIFILQYA